MNKPCLRWTFFKEYSTSILMVSRLIEFALVVLKLLIFQVCVIIGISKIEFFNFSSTERVKKIKKIKSHSKPPKPTYESLFKQYEQIPKVFLVFTETLNLLLLVHHRVGHNTDLHSDSNNTKTVRINITVVQNFLKNIQEAF